VTTHPGGGAGLLWGEMAIDRRLRWSALPDRRSNGRFLPGHDAPYDEAGTGAIGRRSGSTQFLCDAAKLIPLAGDGWHRQESSVRPSTAAVGTIWGGSLESISSDRAPRTRLGSGDLGVTSCFAVGAIEKLFGRAEATGVPPNLFVCLCFAACGAIRQRRRPGAERATRACRRPYV